MSMVWPMVDKYDNLERHIQEKYSKKNNLNQTYVIFFKFLLTPGKQC